MRVNSFGKLLGEAREYVADDTVRIPTGFKTLDELLRGGLRPGHVCLFLGRTGVGKTAVSTQVAVNAATAGHGVSIASLEMGREEMTIRALSAASGLPVWDVEETLLKMREGEEPPRVLMEASRQLRTLSVDDSNKPQWDDLARWVDESERVTGVRPKLVVVDHLKLMKRYGYPRGEAERVAQLSEDAKAFAKDTSVAALVFHQVGRSVEASDRKNHGDIPLSMEDAMYGGEQDADYVFGVYRPELSPRLDDVERQAVANVMMLQVLKNRHGAQHLKGVALRWKRPSMRFEEMTSLPDYLGKDDAA